LNSGPRTKTRVHPRFKLCSKKKRMTMWRPLPKIDRKSSLRPTHKIVANRIGKTTGHRTIIGATTNNHGDPALTTIQGQATTPTETKQLAFSARN